VFEAASWVKPIGLYTAKSILKTSKKRNMEMKEIFKSQSERWLRDGIHSLLRRADA